ncbi:hypothetical protein [Streptomyces sp. NPDC054829]
MVAVTHTVLLRAVPHSWFGALVAALVELAEECRVVDGRVVLPDGTDVEGTRLVTGRHLRPGAVYSVDDGEGGACRIAVKEWNRRRSLRARFEVKHPEAFMTWEAGLRGVDRPLLAEVSGEAQVVDAPKMFSNWAGSVRLRFEDWWAAADSGTAVRTAPLRIRLRGRPFRAEVRAAPRPAGDDRHWRVQVTVTARGRGLLRPVAAVVLPLTRRRVQHSVAKSLDSLAESWNEHLPPLLELDRAALREEILRHAF